MIQSWVRLKIEVLVFAMVGPLTSKQIALSFGNSIIIADVRARRMIQFSLFNNTQRKIVVCCLFVLLHYFIRFWLSTHRAKKDAFSEKIIRCTAWEFLNP